MALAVESLLPFSFRALVAAGPEQLRQALQASAVRQVDHKRPGLFLFHLAPRPDVGLAAVVWSACGARVVPPLLHCDGPHTHLRLVPEGFQVVWSQAFSQDLVLACPRGHQADRDLVESQQVCPSVDRHVQSVAVKL
jgi:hypothetical protein